MLKGACNASVKFAGSCRRYAEKAFQLSVLRDGVKAAHKGLSLETLVRSQLPPPKRTAPLCKGALLFIDYRLAMALSTLSTIAAVISGMVTNSQRACSRFMGSSPLLVFSAGDWIPGGRPYSFSTFSFKHFDE